MKRVCSNSRRATLALRLALSIVLIAFLPLFLRGGAPSWWSAHSVLLENAPADDYSPANQGQLKNIAKAAAAEMDARLPGGAGETVHHLIASWSTASAQTNDFAPVNLGQLKSVAKPFYDRLIAAKYATGHPWRGAARLPHDFAVTNVGQVKQLFNFDFTATNLEHDSDQDGLPDWWEKYYFGDTTVDPNALAPRGDGLTNLQSFQQGLDPITRSPQNLSIQPDRIDQTLLPGQVAAQTFTVTNHGNVARVVDISAHNNSTVKLGFTDSDQPNGPQFVWNDISVTGIHLDNVSDTDDGFEAVEISFAFPYFVDAYSTVYVSSNGFVTLGSGSNRSGNGYLLPSPGAPSNLIAPFFTDLNLSESGDVYFQDYGDRVVFQFENAARYAGDGFSTFQIVLERDGTVRFYYKDMEGTLDDALVGLQNATGDKGLTIAFREPYLKSGLAVAITQTAKWFDPTPVHVVVQAGAVQTFTVTLDSRSFPLGTLRGELSITTDNPDDAAFPLPVTMTIVDENQIDSDEDGLTNEDERRRGTNPANADTDGDGMPDGWEVANHLNPLTNDASADPDGDGFTSLQEYQNFTNPFEYTAPVTFIDKFDDWSHMDSRSENWQLDNATPEIFGGDTSRAVRLSSATATLDYWAPALISVDATIYYQGVLRPDQVRFFTSLDGYTWTEVNVARIADSPGAGDWRRAVISRNSVFAPANYYFRIEISGAELASNPQISEIKFVHNDLNPPMADSQNITAVSGTATAVRLSATDADGDAVSYRITEQPAHGTLKGTLPDITYTPAADYVGFDRITFVASDGMRDSYPAMIFVTVTAAPPRAPANLTFTQTSSSAAQLTWSGQGASSYIIERSTDGGLMWQKIGEVNAAITSFTDSTYAADTFYSYRVRAKGQTTSISEPSIQISSKGTNPALADSDGDGIVDNVEAQHHSNLDSKDTDGDGVPDGEDGAPSDPTRWAKPIERHYAVIDLGVLPGTIESWPIALNNAGHVLCGSSDGQRFVWINGERRRLPHNFEAYDLNDSDIVAGDTTYFYSPLSRTVTNGAYWSNGQLIRLPQLMIGRPGYPKSQTYTSSVRAINNAGEIVGWSSPDGTTLFATKWVAGGPGTGLDAPFLSRVFPFAISDSGAVLAAVETNSGYDVDLLPATRLVSSRDANATSNGYRINSAGVIVSRGRQIWPQGATGGAPQDINSLLAPDSATTIDFSYTITNENEILADGHDGTGDADLMIFRLATPTSPAQLYKVVESDPRISWLSPAGMNDNGQIAATANYNDGSPAHAVLLVPAELMVDGNRDGEMSFDDLAVHEADQTSENKPYRFWVNDDDDGASDDRVPPLAPDYADGVIRCIRDLEDFTRLYVNVSGLEQALESGSIKAAFEWKDTSNDPRIKLYRAAKPGTEYLTSESDASALTISPFNETLGEVRSGTPLFLPQGFWVRTSPFSNVPKTLPFAWLLFEGSGEGKGRLVLTLWQDNRRIGETPGVWLDLTDIRKMYQRAIATPESLTPPYESNSNEFDENLVSYRPDVTSRFDPPTEEDPQCLIFVHGWKATEVDAENAAQTMFKRLWWQGFRGRFAAFRWPTKTSAFSYNTSEWLAWKYGKSLNDYVTKYVKQQLPEYSVTIAAHSMGNIVTASALKRGMTLNKYMLMQAAIPAGCYSDSVNNYARFSVAEAGTATPDTAAEMGYGLYLRSARENVGSFVSFFNIDDYALATGAINIIFPWWPIQVNWEKNEVDFKPDTIGGGAYQYRGSGLSYFVLPSESTERHVLNAYESMSFVARPRSKAAGAEPHNVDVFGSVLDLRLACGFGRGVDDHSGQFTRPIQQLGVFYKRMLAELK